jgi:hypothetical protein
MRIEAIISLPLGCFDIDRLRVTQDPALSVRTKFSKRIVTTLFNFDPYFLKIVKAWRMFLRTEKLFTDADPLFPVQKAAHESADGSIVADELGRTFWAKTNSAREVWKKRCREAGVEYFSPHSFRHAAIKEVINYCHSPADLKAISLNIGHSKIPTTLFQYGHLDDEERDRRIRNLKAGAETDSEVLREIRNEIKAKEKSVLWYAADLEFVQEMAKGNFGRSLTEKEIKRLKYGFSECDMAADALITAVMKTIEFAMDNKEGQWNSIDADGGEGKK